MKNIWKKNIAVVLGLLLGIMACACTNGQQNENNAEESERIAVDLNTNDTLYLYRNGKSDYKIVIPENSTQYESYAATELQYFFAEATGCELEIVTDTGLSFKEREYYISLGHTKLYEGSGIVCNSELGTDGFKLYTKGNTFICSGYDGYGTLYAAYEFLAWHVGYEAYAVDEIHVDAKREVAAWELALTEVPDIAERMSGYVSTRTGAEAAVSARLRLLASIGGGEPIFGEGKFYGWTHTQLQWILPWADYTEEYVEGNEAEYDEKFNGKWKVERCRSNNPYVVPTDSDGYPWFYPVRPEGWASNGVMCYTNMEMLDEFNKNLLVVIDDNPNETYFHVSMMDVDAHCECDRCAVSDEINGGPSGTMMIFMNKVADTVKEHLAAQGQGREVTIVALAYHHYEVPPVKEKENGEYEAINENVKARDNIMMMLCPINACRAHVIDDVTCERNIKMHTMMHGWGAVCDRIAIYDYDTNYDDPFFYFNNYNTMAYDYNIYKEIGAEFVFALGDIDNPFSNFSELNTYLHSKLLWDTTLEMDALVQKFMHGYYKDAGEEMYAYYKAILSHFDWISRSVDGHKAIEHWYVNHQNGDGKERTAEYWPEYKLLNLQTYLTKAYEKIDASVRSAEEKELLKTRILTEEVCIRYYLLKFYGKSNYTQEVYDQLVEQWRQDCRKAGYSVAESRVTL